MLLIGLELNPFLIYIITNLFFIKSQILNVHKQGEESTIPKPSDSMLTFEFSIYSIKHHTESLIIIKYTLNNDFQYCINSEFKLLLNGDKLPNKIFSSSIKHRTQNEFRIQSHLFLFLHNNPKN